VAAIIAVPLFRLRDVYFAIAVWIFVEIVADRVLIAPMMDWTTQREKQRTINYLSMVLVGHVVSNAVQRR
jgi:ABC-type branched-subunit amino acid transport system permease subunit